MSSLPADDNSPSPREASRGEGELTSVGRLERVLPMHNFVDVWAKTPAPTSQIILRKKCRVKRCTSDAKTIKE